ncbi:MAG: hypothetical protein RIE58_03585 [Vicingaceae bacterium]
MIWSRYNISPLSHVLVVFTLFFMLSCAESPEEDSASQENVVEDANLDVGDTKRALLVESIIRSSPTVSETSEIFAVLGSSFNREYLNDIQNISKYTTLKDMGINLGVYLADIGYVSTFEQSQEVLFYMNSAKKMAEGIGVSDVFDEGTVERMEMNINDKDSVLDIISDLYWKTDGFLKELDRQNISALIICGGWVEGMYIGGRILNDDFDSDIVYARYKDQRKNLKKILRLLDTFEGEENLDYFKQKLSDIDKDYESMPQPEVIIETNDVTDAEKEVLGRISMKILDIRKEICLL